MTILMVVSINARTFVLSVGVSSYQNSNNLLVELN